MPLTVTEWTSVWWLSVSGMSEALRFTTFDLIKLFMHRAIRKSLF